MRKLKKTIKTLKLTLIEFNKFTDLSKIKLGLSYIDKWLVENYPIEKYELLQIINLQRIYPYTNDIEIKKYLQTNINKLCELL